VRRFLTGAGLQLASYVNLTINFRAIAHAQYAYAGVTAATASFLAWVIVKVITDEDDKKKSVPLLLGMMVGGGCADMLGIYLTRTW
jgi:5-hydroxyisourate hydrolase-like protein (transthyretin family)